MMKRNTPNVRSPNPDFDDFEDEFADLRGILSRSAAAAAARDTQQDQRGYQQSERGYQQDQRGYQQGYGQEQSDRYQREREPYRQNLRPVYPSDGRYGYEQDAEPYGYESQPYEEEYDEQPYRYDRGPLRRRSSVSFRILLGVLVAAGAAILFALFTSDATRAVIASAREAIGGVAPDQPTRPEPASTQLTAGDLELKDPARFAAQSARRTSAISAVSTAVAAPAREDVATAYQSPGASPYQGNPSPYQSAPQSRALSAAPAAVTAPPFAALPSAAAPSRRLASDELSTLMRRARGLLAAGDIPSARLLLERAADAQDPNAAFILAQTYDPQVLGTQDTRRIKPDTATARAWYQRAAQLGSPEAQRRLGQLAN